MPARTPLCLLLATLLLACSAAAAAADATFFRLPLAEYPRDDSRLPWGGLNPNFPRCGRAGKHVADDACAPNGTAVLAVADGRVKFAGLIGSCFDNWGWVMVVEHTLPDQSKVCSIYGHCEPVRGIGAGSDVQLGQRIAEINNDCLPHIHFGIYRGAADADGVEPLWLLGYLPNGINCAEYETPWPGNWTDPVQFVLERVAVAPLAWGGLKALYR